MTSKAALAKTAAVAAAAANADLRSFHAQLRGLNGNQRLAKILERPDTMRVVRSLPTIELLATLRDVGVGDALELLELASAEQVQGIIDIDGWRRDRLDSHTTGEWLKAIISANPDRAVGQLRGLDLELLTLLFKVYTQVFDLIEEEQPGDDIGRHSITPDQRYLIVYGGVGGDDALQAALAEAVERMMGRDMRFVLRLCEAVRWELASQLEEDAYRFRNARLADMGYLPMHEAADVLAYLDPDHGASPVAHTVDEVGAQLASTTILPWQSLEDSQHALGVALSSLPDTVRTRVQVELMQTTNRVHAAMGADLGDTDALRASAKQVADTVGTALAYRGKGQREAMSSSLASTNVQTLFRIGNSLMLKLQRELKVRIAQPDSGMQGDGLLRLDSPLREVCAGLLRKAPLVFAGLLDPRRVDHRGVSSLQELAATAAALNEAVFRSALLHRCGAHQGTLSHGALWATLLLQDHDARAAMAQPQPMTRVRVDALATALRDDAAAVRDAMLAAARVRVNALLATTTTIGGRDADAAHAAAERMTRAVHVVMGEELLGVSGHVDVRMISCVWVES
jgi:hypothetical protein